MTKIYLGIKIWYATHVGGVCYTCWQGTLQLLAGYPTVVGGVCYNCWQEFKAPDFCWQGTLHLLAKDLKIVRIQTIRVYPANKLWVPCQQNLGAHTVCQRL